MINVFQPSLGLQELSALEKLFKTNWIGRGNANKLFEASFCDLLKCDSSLLTTSSSCTESLFTIFEHLKLEPEDQVVMSTVSFIGAYNAAVSTGSEVVFVDVSQSTLQPTTQQILDALTEKTKAVLLTPYNTPSLDIIEISTHLKEKNIPLILDVACSPFATIDGKNICHFSDYSCWSFDAMKILCTGDGSAIYAKSSDSISDIKSRLYMGLSSVSGFSSDSDNEWWLFDTSGPYRRSIMNDISSTIGIVQLNRLADFLNQRKSIADYYDSCFSDLSIPTLPQAYNNNKNCSEGSYYFYSILLKSKEQRNAVALELKNQSIYTTFRYLPLHTVPSITKTLGYSANSLPNSLSFSEKMLNIPLHHSLTIAEAQQVVSVIENCVC